MGSKSWVWKEWMAAHLISSFIHAGVVLGAYHWFAPEKKYFPLAEVDLTRSSFIAQRANKGGGYGKIMEEWLLPPKQAKGLQGLPPPVPELKNNPTEILKEDSPLPCEEPCQDGGMGTGGGGSGEGVGQFVPESTLSRRPRWVKNRMTSRDYPSLAQHRRKDGRVVLSVFIDETGRVRDTRLLMGADDLLNQVALRKVQEAQFTPALDRNGKPVACQVTLPIRFELK